MFAIDILDLELASLLHQKLGSMVGLAIVSIFGSAFHPLPQLTLCGSKHRSWMTLPVVSYVIPTRVKVK